MNASRNVVVAMIAACLAAVTTGCGNAGPLADIDAADASLSGLDWTGVDVVVGITTSPAVLTIVDTGGASHSIDVDISGPVVGIIFDVAAPNGKDQNCVLQSSGNLTLPAGKKLKGSDLVGGYFGSEEAGHLAIGGVTHDLTNGSGVKLSGGAVDFGIGMMVGFEWLSINAR